MCRNRFASRARSTLKVIEVIRSIHLRHRTAPFRRQKNKTIIGISNIVTSSIAGSVYISWLFVVSSSFMYNLWSVPLRITFPYQDESNIYWWLIADYIADVVYLADTFLIRPRLRFVREGSWVEDVTDCRKNYIASLGSKVFTWEFLPSAIYYLEIFLLSRSMYYR